MSEKRFVWKSGDSEIVAHYRSDDMYRRLRIVGPSVLVGATTPTDVTEITVPLDMIIAFAKSLK